MLRKFPHRNGSAKHVHNIQKAKTVGQLAGIVPRIYAALEDCKSDHQSTVVEVEDKITKKSISILIDPGSTYNYITSKIVEICAFKKSKHSKSWLVQQAT